MCAIEIRQRFFFSRTEFVRVNVRLHSYFYFYRKTYFSFSLFIFRFFKFLPKIVVKEFIFNIFRQRKNKIRNLLCKGLDLKHNFYPYTESILWMDVFWKYHLFLTVWLLERGYNRPKVFAYYFSMYNKYTKSEYFSGKKGNGKGKKAKAFLFLN